ncbi:phosphatidylserine/phosphatidylglycerophosphate/cardiolipin synthase family protein [Evansella sp. AB-rgal1]|uniref:phospholipase D-like domain-containing protein n=1 Tax=Evansella sp. AB-rgal1 TaxID=3242696 RepID=UPI00359D2DF5
MKNIWRKILKIIIGIFVIYVVYAFVFGVIIFRFHHPNISSYTDNHPPERFFSETISNDRVALVEDRFEAAVARIDIIETAEETLDISYFTLHQGQSTDIFFSSLLDAAERGVKVRLLLDGIFHNLTGNLKDIRYSYALHPNIELKLYEPFSLFKPWTLNNRLHDKYMIADNKIAMIGGRNIGDKYFSPEDNERVTNDRDVVIINVDKKESSVIEEIKDYFEYIWDHEYTEYANSFLTNRQLSRGEENIAYLLSLRSELLSQHPDLYEQSIDWIKKSVETNNITLIHNPIERMNKEPWVWKEITNLIEISSESVFIQSPYIIPTDPMLHHLEGDLPSHNNVFMLTNSLASTPNVLAFSGYLKHREDIVNASINVYEYQGPGSIHAKTYLFDNRLSVIGSFNLDARSAFLSTETMVVIDSEPLSTMLMKEIEYIYSKSLVVQPDGSYVPTPSLQATEASALKTLGTRALSFLTRFFDYML